MTAAQRAGRRPARPWGAPAGPGALLAALLLLLGGAQRAHAADVARDRRELRQDDVVAFSGWQTGKSTFYGGPQVGCWAGGGRDCRGGRFG